MDQAAIDLLTKERVCVLSVPLSDGSPHSALVHYSHTDDPFRIIIQSSPTVKVHSIQEQGGTCKVSVVVGLNEPDSITLQMRGTVRLLSPAEKEAAFAIHHAKHPSGIKYKGPDTVMLEFTPDWWRYTDFNTEPPTKKGTDFV
ncbi:MAG: pyridoxamine 5'-phosphate oxidase family protein [Minisyncoccia bacterium]